MQQIEFIRVESGKWQLEADGILRPVEVVRIGRKWVVRSTGLIRDCELQSHGSTRNLTDARSLMIAVWLHLEAIRAAAKTEADEVAAFMYHMRHAYGN